MTTPAWVKDAVFYQIFPDRFAKSDKLPDLGFETWDSPPTTYGFKGGDLYGAAARLDYLKDLGINAIYLNPIFASASNHRYHTYDYYNVDPLLGGNDAFRFFLDEAHKRGIRVVLDGVFNHASRGFWQFHHVLETGADSPYKDWFHFDPERLNHSRHWGAYPSSVEQKLLQHEDSLTAIGYRAWWNLAALPKFNTDTPAVREFIYGVAEYWLKFGIDGWRLDVPGEINDDEFWREFRRRVRAVNSEAYIVGEIWDEAQRWLQGDQFDATMNYLFTAASLNFFAGEHLNYEVAQAQGGIKNRIRHINGFAFADEVERLLNLYSRENTFSQLNLLDSHDTPRFLSCANGDKDSLKLAWLFIFSMPGAPCIYYGDEIGLDGRHDPDCRKSFPWDENRWDKNLLDYLKACAALRAAEAALRYGDTQRLQVDESLVVFSRVHEGERVVIAFNVSNEPRMLESPFDNPRILFGNAGITGNKITIPPRSGIALK